MYMCKSEAKSNGAWFGCADYEAQEPGDKGEPDIKRPPDSDSPEFDSDHPKGPNGDPGAPGVICNRVAARRRVPTSHDRRIVALARASDVFDVLPGKGRRSRVGRSVGMVAVELGNI